MTPGISFVDFFFFSLYVANKNNLEGLDIVCMCVCEA